MFYFAQTICDGKRRCRRLRFIQRPAHEQHAGADSTPKSRRVEVRANKTTGSQRSRQQRTQYLRYVSLLLRAGLKRLSKASTSNADMSPTAAAIFIAAAGYTFGQLRAPKPAPITSTTPLDSVPALTHDTSPRNLQACWTEIRDIVGLDNVLTDLAARESHAGSAWSTHLDDGGALPFLVARPGSTDEVAAIMRACHARRIPVTAFAGGTSLEGHFAATRGGVCVDFGRMDRVLRLDRDDLDVVVQPAVGWEALNEELAKEGLFFPPDPGPGAMIGGMVGTGCSGTNAYRWGTMREWVISLTVVLADGTIVKTKQRPRKSSAGYDLTKLFIGSEGTLGLITEATLKVVAKPKEESVAVCSFRTVKDAAETVSRVVKGGIPIAAIEILCDEQMRCINRAGMTSRHWKEAPTLFFKFSGATQQSVQDCIKQVRVIAKQCYSQSFEFARTKEEKEELWSARKEALWATMAAARGEHDRPWTTDVAVPMSRLAEIIDETKADINESGLLASIVGHVGDGNFHAIIMHNPENAEEREKTEALVHRMVKRAIEMEGTATGEHGVGLVKRDYLPHELGETTVDLMRRVKFALDPLCLLNPDKVVRVVQPKPGEVQEW